MSENHRGGFFLTHTVQLLLWKTDIGCLLLKQWWIYFFHWCQICSWMFLRQPHLSAIVHSRRFSLFSHIARMPDETDAKKILTASSLENWRRPPGRPRTVLCGWRLASRTWNPITLPQWSNWLGSESSTVETDAYIWCYALVVRWQKRRERRRRTRTIPQNGLHPQMRYPFVLDGMIVLSCYWFLFVQFLQLLVFCYSRWCTVLIIAAVTPLLLMIVYLRLLADEDSLPIAYTYVYFIFL